LKFLGCSLSIKKMREGPFIDKEFLHVSVQIIEEKKLTPGKGSVNCTLTSATINQVPA
jgi:hypothetical protein